MEPTFDSEGFLLKVTGKFGYGREVALTKWNDLIYLHINDNSKCWNNGQFDKTKSKSLSFKWTDVVNLRECLKELQPFAEQIETEQHIGIPMHQAQAYLDEPFDTNKENNPSNLDNVASSSQTQQQQQQQQQQQREVSKVLPIQPKFRRYQAYLDETNADNNPPALDNVATESQQQSEVFKVLPIQQKYRRFQPY